MRTDWTADWPARHPVQHPNGYVYVIEFTGKTIKVGRTDSPRTRIREHQRAAAKFGGEILRAWLLPLHGARVANESHLIAEAERVGTALGGREYFQADYEPLVEVAASLDMTRAEPTPPEPLIVS